jgi:hypothetical protein
MPPVGHRSISLNTIGTLRRCKARAKVGGDSSGRELRVGQASSVRGSHGRSLPRTGEQKRCPTQ